MRILALQLKRIGDLVLTTPALAEIKRIYPNAHLALAVHSSTASLLPMIAPMDSAIVFGPGRGWAPWQQVLTGAYDVVLDFTGTDRSALAAALSRAARRVTFAWVRKKGLRSLAYHEFVESDVRDRHTITHYCDLLRPLGSEGDEPRLRLRLPDGSSDSNPELSAHLRNAVLIHPGSARAEKFWLTERWAEVIRHIQDQHKLPTVITVGPDPAERAHVESIISSAGVRSVSIYPPPDLCALARVIAESRLVVSCDTATVHIAAAFQRPQIALFGPTNPFHWRPRHDRAVVISAAQPDAPLIDFSPRMKGAPMDRVSTGVVCRAIDALLAAKPSP